MPVGAPPSPEKLQKWQPQLEAMLADPVALCRHGGRVLGERRPDGTVREFDKWNGYSIRPLAYCAETGRYPDRQIPRCDDRPGCIDCGRFVFDAEPVSEPEVIPAPPPVPQPAAAPRVVAGSGPAVEAPEPGRVPDRAPGLLPAVVPVSVPPVWRPPRWVWAVGAAAGLFVGVLVCMTLLVQAAGFGASKLGESLPDVDVELPSSTTAAGM
jgi:hypothetical protein